EAARSLRISIKALRLYESWGLVIPRRTARGWRFYTPEDIERLSRTLALKAMGFGLAQIVGLLDAEPEAMAAALAAQERLLDERRRALDEA
ncbi:MAG TPA: MerR family transcriptional regulator, partial [Caulobacter sp.]|nr:MerR family transcriptional regulator [Caulobacter sp.]